jgi:hypothetical protein
LVRIKQDKKSKKMWTFVTTLERGIRGHSSALIQCELRTDDETKWLCGQQR